MKKIVYLFSALICIVLGSCQKNANDYAVEDFKINTGDTTFIYGLSCGWCAGIDSLVISGNEMLYISNIPCNHKNEVEHKTLKNDDKINLLNSFNEAEFSKIHLNTCYVCADGCDYWISVQYQNYYHIIRFGVNDSVSGIKDLIGNLERLKSRFGSRLGE